MSPADVIRAAMPDATDADCEFVLWERTPFPFERMTARKLYKAASGLVRAGKSGIVLCDLCSRKADFDRFTCKPCAVALKRADA